MTDCKFLAAVRAQIAIRGLSKKHLAIKFGVNPGQFSEMTHGIRIMPFDVQEKLIQELDLKPIWQSLSAPAEVQHD